MMYLYIKISACHIDWSVKYKTTSSPEVSGLLHESLNGYGNGRAGSRVFSVRAIFDNCLTWSFWATTRVIKWDRSINGLLFQCASTKKIQQVCWSGTKGTLSHRNETCFCPAIAENCSFCIKQQSLTHSQTNKQTSLKCFIKYAEQFVG
jgi:hypothetical protein